MSILCLVKSTCQRKNLWYIISVQHVRLCEICSENTLARAFFLYKKGTVRAVRRRGQLVDPDFWLEIKNFLTSGENRKMLQRVKRDDLYALRVSAKEASEFLKLNERTFYRMVEDGTIPKVCDGEYILGEVTEAYFHSQNSSTGLKAARTRLANAKAEMAELELYERRGEVVKIADVSKLWADSVANVKAKLLAIPSKMARSLVGHEEIVIEKRLKEAIYDVLKELAEYDGQTVDENKEATYTNDE